MCIYIKCLVRRESFLFSLSSLIKLFFAQQQQQPTLERGVCLFVCSCVVCRKVGRLVLVGVDDDDDDDCVFPSPLQRGTSVSS